MELNARERFVRLMTYQDVDRLPVMAIEPFEQSTIQRWHREGMPAEQSPYEYFKLDRLQWAPIDWSAIPAFEAGVLYEDDEYIVKKEPSGCTVRCRKEDPTQYYGFIDHPVKTRKDWDAYKERLEPDISYRLHSGWAMNTIEKFNQSENPVGFFLFPWFFRLGFYSMGMEKFMLTFAEDPDWIHDMFSFWADFAAKLMDPIIAKLRIDYAAFAEDLAYKTSTHISPRMYEEFWLPYQNKIVEKLTAKGVKIISLWSAGNVNGLLEMLLDHKVNTSFPLECAADGMNALDLRKRYGKRLLLGGGIAKEALVAGPSAINKEIDRLMPLIKDGGFIPALDDMVPPDVPISHYHYLVEKLRDIRL